MTLERISPWVAAGAVLAFVLAFTAAAWIVRGKLDEAEFKDRIEKSPHKVDTVRVERLIPQPAEHHEARAVPQALPAPDSARIAEATKSRDSARALLTYVAAPVDTTFCSAYGGSARVRYQPLTRMLTLDLIPSPVREVEMRITDSAQVPVVEHDSWTTRVAIGAIGVALGVVVGVVAH